MGGILLPQMSEVRLTLPVEVSIQLQSEHFIQSTKNSSIFNWTPGVQGTLNAGKAKANEICSLSCGAWSSGERRMNNCDCLYVVY